MTALQQQREPNVVRIVKTEGGSWVREYDDGTQSTPYGSREAAEAKDAPAKRPQSEQLVELALQRYQLHVTTSGEPCAVPLVPPYVVQQLRGHGGGRSLRAELAAAFYDAHGKVASATALRDAMETLEGKASEGEVVTDYLRVAPLPRGVLLDLGRADGQVVEVTDEGWEVWPSTHDAPLFRRTKLTGELPIPADEGSLELLRALVNVTDRDWPLLLGWLVAGLLPDLPHPIALLTGEQGTGKTTAGRQLVSLLDPSAVPLRTGPRDETGWGVAASASWVVGIDNVSTISPWLSDAMCRAVTGDGVVARELFTNDGLHLLHFRRVLLLTSIDAGALRGDLAERLLTIELDRIPAERRRTDAELAEDFRAAHARILAGLLDLTAEVLAHLPYVRGQLPTRPRMADFAEVLAAMDKARGTDALGEYLRGAERLSRDVAEHDPVGAAVLDLMATAEQDWRGPSSALLAELRRVGADQVKGFPSTPQALSGRLKTIAPALRQHGVDVDSGRSNGTRFWTLHRLPEDTTP